MQPAIFLLFTSALALSWHESHDGEQSGSQFLESASLTNRNSGENSEGKKSFSLTNIGTSADNSRSVVHSAAKSSSSTIPPNFESNMAVAKIDKVIATSTAGFLQHTLPSIITPSIITTTGSPSPVLSVVASIAMSASHDVVGTLTSDNNLDGAALETGQVIQSSTEERNDSSPPASSSLVLIIIVAFTITTVTLFCCVLVFRNVKEFQEDTEKGEFSPDFDSNTLCDEKSFVSNFVEELEIAHPVPALTLPEINSMMFSSKDKEYLLMDKEYLLTAGQNAAPPTLSISIQRNHSSKASSSISHTSDMFREMEIDYSLSLPPQSSLAGPAEQLSDHENPFKSSMSKSKH
ncbi:hypothetical protein HDV06_001931 [Boothiomyces sp. JEL0866]|nr:hypothetical protein HDV06_001931 [Boothiomyces sp. JEL0866]